VKNFISLTLIVCLQVLGNVWLSRGIKEVGEVNTFKLSSLVLYGFNLVINPWVILGVAFLAAFFLLYLVALSRLDLSYVLPMTASGYVLNAVFAWLMLGENISATRWAGTVLVAIGVLIVAINETKPGIKKGKIEEKIGSEDLN
jgi:drug/metabolite transporter (DMT)-like permease